MLEHITQNFQIYMNGTPLVALTAAFLAGVLVSLTPCVYPMIPLTVAYLGGGSAGATRGRRFMLALFYVLGMALTYAALGIVSALANKVFGFAASSPVVMIVVGIFFVLFGLSMVDIFALPLPASLTNFQPKKRAGIVGALVVGALSGFIAAPCSSPVLLAILTHIAQRGGVLYGSALMFSYALGMGLLMLVIGFSAGAAVNLPKSGVWMVWVKRICGAALIVAGIYFAVSGGIRMHHNAADSNAHNNGIRSVTTEKFIVASDTAVVEKEIGKRPMFLVFYGTWCTKCTHEIPALNALYDEYKKRGLMFYAVDIDDPEKKARQFIEKHGIRYPVIFDATREVFAQEYEIMSTPTIIVFARNGKILYNGGDAPDKIRPYIEKVLE